MQGGDVQVVEKTVLVTVNPDLLVNEQIVSRMTDERTRFDFNLTVSKVTVEVEKIVVKDAGLTRIISASTRDIGPPKMDVTWDFLTHMTIMVAQYAMPLNRLASMITLPEKRFNSAKLSRIFCYVAQRFMPIYLHNFRSLANSKLLSGDDTTTKVLEFSRHLKAIQADPNTEAPWLDFATREAADATHIKSLHHALESWWPRNLALSLIEKMATDKKSHCKQQLIRGEVSPKILAAP